MHITGGEFIYERRCKTGDFEHKHFSAKFTFSLDEGEDYVDATDRIGVLAVAKVHKMLGLKLDAGQTIELPIQRTTAPAVRVDESPKQLAAPAPPAPATEAPAKSRRSPPRIKAPSTAEDNQPLPLGEELPGLADTSAPKAQPQGEPALPTTDPMADLLGMNLPAEPEVTDVDICKKVQHKVASFAGNPDAPRIVGVLIRKYGATSIAIPQEYRHQFLRELEALKV